MAENAEEQDRSQRSNDASPPIKNLKCPECGDSFPSEYGLWYHRKHDHKIKNLERPAGVPGVTRKPFLKALLWTAIPMLLLYPVFVFFTVVSATLESPFSVTIAVVSAIVGGLAILVCFGFAIARKRQIALGILAGAAIGLIGSGLTCFAMFAQ